MQVIKLCEETTEIINYPKTINNKLKSPKAENFTILNANKYIRTKYTNSLSLFGERQIKP